jgi:hypothetical protein
MPGKAAKIFYNTGWFIIGRPPEIDRVNCPYLFRSIVWQVNNSGNPMKTNISVLLPLDKALN